MKAPHVVFLAQYLPLHFASTMRHFGRMMGRTTLLLSEPMDESRDWTPDFGGLEVRVQRSLRIPIRHRHPLGFRDRGNLILPRGTARDLRALCPDVVISVEVGARTLQAAACRALGGKFRLIVQVRESENTARSRGALRWAIRRMLLPRADGVFVNGASGERHVRACGVDPARISRVPSGTDTEVFGRILACPGIGPLRLLYVGQLIPRKGLLDFARALATQARRSGRPVLWRVAGRGPEEAALRDHPWPANVRLELLGSRPYRELPELYASSDVFVMPSLSDEWGMVVNEAMASGLPILGSTGVQAVQELIRDGRDGWTFPPRDAAGLDQALGRLFETPLRGLAEMGANAWRQAVLCSDRAAAAAMAAGVEKALAGG